MGQRKKGYFYLAIIEIVLFISLSVLALRAMQVWADETDYSSNSEQNDLYVPSPEEDENSKDSIDLNATADQSGQGQGNPEISFPKDMVFNENGMHGYAVSTRVCCRKAIQFTARNIPEGLKLNVDVE